MKSPQRPTLTSDKYETVANRSSRRDGRAGARKSRTRGGRCEAAPDFGDLGEIRSLGEILATTKFDPSPGAALKERRGLRLNTLRNF